LAHTFVGLGVWERKTCTIYLSQCDVEPVTPMLAVFAALRDMFFIIVMPLERAGIVIHPRWQACARRWAVGEE
jgi:hypothetical protein